MDTLRILELWAATAWADGHLHPNEAAALERRIEASPDLSRAELETARRLLSHPPDVSVDAVQALDAIAREGVYRAALGIVALDGVLHERERAFITRLRAALGLAEATLVAIEAEHGIAPAVA
ncbi:MAG: DUF533 domain-containing protein [Polyangiales bacterium]|nr:DUF533 domain-containing protein [Myxococcales bacterium]MCB9660779.1 DUF533 domain-containing protein [Sandaracinaceae bacterium]